ncbi:MAG TPA: HEAT repeat domain-containing protein, partial [Planctomycetota bacterium]|nr:HEAT repeat domain-containing protein [Planctomycetota bacterium]
LAKAAAGKDVAVALSAAHALRRLDGEEDFNIVRWVASDKLYSQASPRDAGLWQVPLGAAFPDPVPAAALEALAGSSYVPLREAAARLAAGCGAGQAIAKKLSGDPSLLVRQAAARTLRRWESPKPVSRPIQKPDLAKRWEATVRDEIGTRDSGPFVAAFGTDEDIVKLIDLCRTTKSEHIRIRAKKALADYSGGSAATEFFRHLASSGEPWPAANHLGSSADVGKRALAAVCDGEALAKELGPRLGVERWMLHSEFLLARFSGPPALPHLEKFLTVRGFSVPLVVGYVGGPDAVTMIAPLLDSKDLSAATAAARGLGESAQLAAVQPLIQALSSSNRVVRSRAALALGRIGGPDAAKALAAIIEREKEYLPRRSAWAMLREIEAGRKEHAELIARAKKELDEFVPAYNPVNPQFGADFPTGKVVVLDRAVSVASFGETRCAVDARVGVWIRYGGCDMCYSNECIGYDPASGKQFIIRPNEVSGLFFNETRAGAGCSRGLVYCWHSRRFWMNNATGFPTDMTRRTDASTYDLALDRFDGHWPQTTVKTGEGPKWYIADSRRGHVYNEFMGPVTDVIDTRTASLISLPFKGLPRLQAFYVFDAAGYDPVADLVLREVKNHKKHTGQPPENFGVWLMDPGTGTARKSKSPLPEGERGSQGLQMVFDSLNRDLILLRSTGAYAYDRETDTWRKAADGNFGVTVFDFDPQHNVFIGLRSNQMVAFRLKNVPVGTKAFFGPDAGAPPAEDK